MRILLSRWSYSLLGTALLAGLAWYFGPLLAALEDPLARFALIAAMLAVWGGINAAISLRHSAQESALSKGVAGGDAAGEMAAIEDKITTALTLLKKARGNRGYLYEQPWYVIIGPPGAGKTTALLNAGLEFPLAKEMGRGAVAGVGGTRLCEWWFTDQAVMIDTAGRYTTQDSDAEVDRAGWDKFLDLLKRTRPRQPLNGVIVAIALSDIAQSTKAERLAHARAIRTRIGELETKFGMRLPVYALFTKADLLAGFMEFFDDLDRDGRAQVWGTTFAYDPKAEDAVAGFTAAYRDLVERIGHRLLDRLQAEQNPERRAAIAGFPTQVASLEAPLTEFVAEAFGPSASSIAPILRGVYLNSATQEGTPIDRLTGAIARAFGLSPQRQARLRPQEGRTYFLTRLLRDVVFNEAMLVSGGARKPRGFLVTGIALAVALIAVLATGGLLWRAHSAGQRAIDAGAAMLAAYEQAATGLPLDPVADADLTQLVPLLDRALAAIPGDLPEPAAWDLLAQDGKLAAGLRGVYRHAIERALFPRLIWRLEAQLRGNLNHPDFVYEATRVYLMLTSNGPIDRDLLREWMTLDWQAAYPGPDAAPLRASLTRHLDGLLGEPLPAIVADGELVAAARATFGQVSLAQRVYSRLRPSAAAQAIPAWRPSDALGAAGVVIFVRASGRSFDDGVPGFYTPDGFHKVLLPALAQAARQAASEGWVLGQKIELDPQGPQMRALEQEVIALYLADFARVWDEMLADLNLAPLRSLTQAAQDLFILSSENSPLRALVVSLARQLALAEPQAAAKPAVTTDAGSRFQSLLGAKADPAARPGREVDARYKPLRDLAGAPLDRLLRIVADLQQQLARLAAAGLRAGPQPTITGDDPAVLLRTEALRQPNPVGRWFNTTAASGLALRGGDPKLQVVAAYNAAGGPAALCAAATNNRYPFTASAKDETPLDEFARLFAPGGVIDGFFNTFLRPYVDAKSAIWKPVTPEGSSPAVQAPDVAQFQRAALIRDMFFADGRTTPLVRFDVTPASIDARAKGVTISLDGTDIAFVRGAPRATEISWPSPGAAQAARLLFDPPPQGANAAWQESGVWAIYRLLGRGRMQPGTTPEKSAITFQAGDRQAVFDLRTAARNPLATGVLQAFRCPSIQ